MKFIFLFIVVIKVESTLLSKDLNGIAVDFNQAAI